MKKKLVTLSGLVLGFAPVVAFAQRTTGTVSVCNATIADVNDLLCRISQILGAIVPVLIALGIVYFVYGIITYVIADDEEAKTSGRDRIIAGIIGLAVIVSVWGLVRVLTRTFNTGDSTTITLPTIPY